MRRKTKEKLHQLKSTGISSMKKGPIESVAKAPTWGLARKRVTLPWKKGQNPAPSALRWLS